MSLRPVAPALLVRGRPEDPRLGSRVGAGDAADVVVIGAADDTGVRHSGGRVGAAEGPAAIRRWLYRQTTGMDGELERLSIQDVGDIVPDGDMEATHRALEETVATHSGSIVLLLGGGHDLSYASHSGLLSSTEGRAAILNVDAHLDVRPLRDGRVITSGTPFRRVLERWEARVARFEALGIQPQHNSAADARWLKDRGGLVRTLGSLREPPGAVFRMIQRLDQAAQQADFATVSIDLDGVAAAFAPGVSAPPADGFHPDELLSFAEAAGNERRVRLFELMELSPPHDENERTARLAALLAWRFLAGVAARKR